MSEQDLLFETADRLFAQVSTFDEVQAAQASGWSQASWDAADALGLTRIGIGEEAGGVGGSTADVVALLIAAGYHAVALPLAESTMIAGWLANAPGVVLPQGPVTVIPNRAGDTLRLEGDLLSGTAHRVPWGRNADLILGLVDDHIVGFTPSQASIHHDVNVAGEPRDDLSLNGITPVLCVAALPEQDPQGLALVGALSRSALMAGALLRIVDITAQYTQERKQFGKPVGSFQAVQLHVVRCAEHAAQVDLAVQVAARECDRGEASFEIAVAKTLANDAARIASRAAHQAHGAMGMTQEYLLHQYTRRLWAWRSEYGDAAWVSTLGEAVVALGADHHFHISADGSASGIEL